MDQRGNFGKLYEEVHGEGTWDNFLDEYMETVVERVDWTREVVR